MHHHLIELRRRLIHLLILFGGLFLLFFYLSPHLFYIIISPLAQALPRHSTLIATQITTAITTPITIAMNSAMLATTPIALWHIWRFVIPGLYQHEQKTLRLALTFSVVLFITGLLFSYYLVLPWMFLWFSQSLPSAVQLMPDMAYSIDFITHMLLIFGLCFQIPLLCVLLVRTKIITHHTLITLRPYVIVLAFIIGMLLTPPDVLSQIMLALPLCLLYEMGVFLARLSHNRVSIGSSSRR